MGYSTIGSRIAKNRHSALLGPSVVQLSEKEIGIIKSVITRATEMERMNRIRSGSVHQSVSQSVSVLSL